MNAFTSAAGAMSQPELFTLHAPGLGAGALTPGRLSRALHLAFGVSADAIGLVVPERPGLFLVALTRDAAARIHTPASLPVPAAAGVGHRAATAELRRPGDPHGLPSARAIVRWEDGGPPPPVGSLARALDGVDGLSLFGEDLGAVVPNGDALVITLSPSSLTVPGARDLVIDGRPMHLTLLTTA
jgi:hypothetical protein